MRYLLDTHVWLWLNFQPDRIARPVESRLTARESEVLLSAASCWEIAIKHALGRLPLHEHPVTLVPRRLQDQGIAGAPVELSHALAVASLPPHHKDPFDRLLVAQAQALDAVLVTADRQIAAYDVEVLDPTA